MQIQTQTQDPTTRARKRKRLFLLVLCLLVTAVCLASCSFGVEHGPHGEVQRTDNYTFNTERRDITQRVTKDQESFKGVLPGEYHLAATVDVNPDRESGVDGITYEVMIDEVRMPMMNVIQTFTLDPDMFQVIDAAELFHSNVGNTYETTLRPDKEPLGLGLSRSYVLRPKSEISAEYLQNYTDVYVKISYGPEDQREEDYIHLQAKPSSRMIEYMKFWE
nr:hypothetical protein [Paenibacillus xylanexedens]